MTHRRVVLTVIVSCILASLTIYVYQRVVAQTSHLNISGKFYKFDTVAQLGQNGITAIGITSLNDSGTIAIVGRSTSVVSPFIDQLFISKINGQVTAVTAPTLPDGTDRRIFGSMQINNSNQIITQHERSTAGANPQFAQDVRR